MQFEYEDGFRRTRETLEVEATITGTTSHDTALAYAEDPNTGFPAFVGTLVREPNSVEVEELAEGYWKARARYIKDPDQGDGEGGGSPPVAREISVQVSSSVTSANVTHGEDVQRYDITPGNPGPDFNGAINVDDEGKIEGAEIQFSETSFTVTKEFPAAEIDNTFIQTIEALLHPKLTYNDATFRGRAAGEVLFTSYDFTKNVDDVLVPVAFHYLISKNLTAGTIGPFSPVTKKGWDLAWVYSESQEFAGRTVKSPVSLYIVKVYNSGDLSSVGIDA